MSIMNGKVLGRVVSMVCGYGVEHKPVNHKVTSANPWRGFQLWDC